MNNLGSTDYINSILQCLLRVKKLRDYFLLYETSHQLSTEKQNGLQLTSKMGEFFRKVWNPVNFKDHVSPHELVKVIGDLSKQKFSTKVQADPALFYIWLVNWLHSETKDKVGRCRETSAYLSNHVRSLSRQVSRQNHQI